MKMKDSLTKYIQKLTKDSTSPEVVSVTSDNPMQRMDSWTNILTGINSEAKDKRLASNISWMRFPPEVAENIYSMDKLARKIVETIVDTSLADDFKMAFGELNETKNSEINLMIREEMHARFNLGEVLKTWFYYGRCYGAGYLYVDAVDGGEPTDPLNLSTISKINSITLLSPRECYPQQPQYIMGKDYLEPDLYTIATATGHFVASVHNSRIIRSNGERLLRLSYINNQYRHDSILNAIHQLLADYSLSVQSCANVVADFSQGIYKLKGLSMLVNSGNQQKVIDRMSLMERSRSLIRAIVLDADTESYERISGQFTGISEPIEKIRQELVARTNIPHNILFNESTGNTSSIGGTGDDESEISDWQEQVKNYQKKELEPSLRSLFNILLSSQELKIKGLEVEKRLKFTISFNSARGMSLQKEAETLESFAGSDIAYLDAGVITPDEVRQRFFPNGTFSTFASKLDIKSESKAPPKPEKEKKDPLSEDEDESESEDE